jgi:hypothetical protein
MISNNVLTYLREKVETLTESFGTKQSCKNSYTICKGQLEEKHDEQAKAEI